MNARKIGRGDRLVALAMALCAAVAAALALAAPAGASNYRIAKFKVELKGWQKAVHQHTHESQSPCDPDDYSSGSETVRFRSKPVVVMATRYPGQDNPQFFATRYVGVPTVASVSRSFTPRLSNPRSGECGEYGSGIEIPTNPDCGSKTVRPFPVNLVWGVGRRDQDKLVLNSGSSDDPFRGCPGIGGGGFPTLIAFDARDEYIGAQISQAELFDPRFRKWISIANGSRRVRERDHWYRTTIHWEVSFTRLRG